MTFIALNRFLDYIGKHVPLYNSMPPPTQTFKRTRLFLWFYMPLKSLGFVNETLLVWLLKTPDLNPFKNL